MVEETNIGLSEEDVRGEKGPDFAGMMQAMGDNRADGAAIAASEDGRLIQARMVVMSMPEGSEESASYWRRFEKGLDKKLHGEGLNKWASFVPVSSETDPDRRYPLIFCLHGANNPIQLAESYGIVQLAAREECIVIVPENENWDFIEELYHYAKAHFPVDFSRVYSIGYSFGGFMSARNVLSHPEFFAGVGMGGMLFASSCPGQDLSGQWYEAFELTEAMLARAEELQVPAALFMGEYEMLRLIPLWREPGSEMRNSIIPLTPANKRESFNNFRRAAGCAPADFLTEDDTASETEQVIGVRFDRTEVRTLYGRRYFIGDSLNRNGACLLRTIGAEKMVHWPTPPFADLIWEHLHRFSRNPDTGELSVVGSPSPAQLPHSR